MPGCTEPPRVCACVALLLLCCVIVIDLWRTWPELWLLWTSLSLSFGNADSQPDAALSDFCATVPS